MLAASIPVDPRITLDDCEIRREGVSYTIDTIADIQGRCLPQGRPGLILGDDLARNFSQWHRAEEIARSADIIIARRESAVPVSFPFPYTALDNGILELSSGDIRRRIRNRENWRYLVPQGARFIIQDRGLYGYDEGGSPEGPSPDARFSAVPSWSLIAGVEAAARAALSPGRFLHSRNAALLAWDICSRFGWNGLGRAAYLAGIAHDICKPLPLGEQLRLAASPGPVRKSSGGKHGAQLHGEAGAAALRERFGVTNQDILDAVRFHTTGAAGMGPLAKAVFIADKVEPSRRGIRGELRDPARYESLDAFFEAVLEDNAAYLKAKAVELSPGTCQLLETMRKRRGL
jgi:nicotinate-nucleotide adenylyltransferase